MGKTIGIMYLIYTALLIGGGLYIYKKMTDLENPSSFINRVNELEKVLNEDSEISR